MKFQATLAIAALISVSASAQVPKIFQGILEQNVPVRAEIGMVMPPRDIEKYDAKVRASAQKDPKGFREFASKFKPGAPLPFDERLGLTKEEYADYVALWAKREFTPMAATTLLLRKGSADAWTIIATDKASSIATLRYSEKDDVFRSPSGDLKRIEDINADASSALGEWTGYEWKFAEETEFDKSKQNFAIGRLADGKHGLIVYVNQSISTAGSKMLLDTSLVIRFPLSKPGAAKDAPATKDVPAKPAAKTPVKPAAKPAAKPAKPAAKPAKTR